VIRWLLVVFLALLLFSGLRPWLEKLGWASCPATFASASSAASGSSRSPAASLLSLLAMLIGKLL
jgi:hypothetical protein